MEGVIVENPRETKRNSVYTFTRDLLSRSMQWQRRKRHKTNDTSYFYEYFDANESGMQPVMATQPSETQCRPLFVSNFLARNGTKANQT